MILYEREKIVFTEKERETLKQLEELYKQGGRWLYAEGSFEGVVNYYSIYTDAETPLKRRKIALLYGEIVLLLNAMLRQKLLSQVEIFDIKEFIEKFLQ